MVGRSCFSAKDLRIYDFSNCPVLNTDQGVNQKRKLLGGKSKSVLKEIVAASLLAAPYIGVMAS
jgi:hypothetical protein